MMGEEAFRKQADAGPWAIGSSSSSMMHIMSEVDMAGLRELH